MTLNLIHIIQAAISMLKQEYKEGLKLEEAKALAIKILSKTLDTTKLTPEKRKLFQ